MSAKKEPAPEYPDPDLYGEIRFWTGFLLDLRSVLPGSAPIPGASSNHDPQKWIREPEPRSAQIRPDPPRSATRSASQSHEPDLMRIWYWLASCNHEPALRFIDIIEHLYESQESQEVTRP